MGPGTPYRFAYSPDTRFDTIILGCLIALLFYDENAKKWIDRIFRRTEILILGIIILTGSVYLSEQSRFFMSTIGFSLSALGFVFIIIFVLLREDHTLCQLMSLKPLQITGSLSYALYLWHTVSLGLAGRITTHVNASYQGIAHHFVYLALTFLLAIASYILIEQPFLRLKDKFTLVRANS